MGIDVKYIIRKLRKELVVLALFVAVYFIVVGFMKGNVQEQYEHAKSMYDNKEYAKSAELFEALGNYEDSKERLLDSENGLVYRSAEELLAEGELEAAANKFLEIIDYSDSKERVIQVAESLSESGKYESAIRILKKLEDSPESELLISEVEALREDAYSLAYNLYEDGKCQEALAIFRTLEGYKESKTYVDKCKEIIHRHSLAHTTSCGMETILGITESRSVIASGKTGIFNFSEWNDIVSVSIGNVIAVGLKQDGTAVSSGQVAGSSIDVSDWEDIIAVCAGERYIVGLKDDGTVVSQGHNGDGQRNLDDWHDIIRIAACWRCTVGLDKNGEIHTAGYGQNSLKNQIDSNKEDWSDVIEIAAGGGGAEIVGHIVGLKSDGTVVAVGYNDFGQCNVNGDEWHDIIAIAAGSWHTVGLRADGTVVSTKPNDDALDYDGSPLFTQCCEVNQLNDIVAISAGQGTTVCVKKDGSVVALGYNSAGQRNGARAWSDIAIYDLPQQSYERP